MAPERLLEDAFDHRADVFSAGVLLWEAITGRTLFREMTVDEIITQLMGGKIAPPAPRAGEVWDDSLAEVAMFSISVDPAQRWPHVGIVGAQIETIVGTRLASSAEVAAYVRKSPAQVTVPSTSLSPLVTSTRPGVPPIPEQLLPPELPEIPQAVATLRTSWAGISSLEAHDDALVPRRGKARTATLVWGAAALSFVLGGLSVYEVLRRRETPLAPAAAVSCQCGGSRAAANHVTIAPRVITVQLAHPARRPPLRHRPRRIFQR